MLKLSRRGHAGTVLLVFVALILIGVALYTFVTFKNTISVDASALQKLSNDVAYSRVFVRGAFEISARDAHLTALRDGASFEPAFRARMTQLAEQQRETWKNKTNLFGELSTGDYTISHVVGSYVVTVPDVFVTQTSEKTELHYTTTLTVSLPDTLDKQKTLLE